MKYSETNWGKKLIVCSDLQLLQRISQASLWPQTDLDMHMLVLAAALVSHSGRQTDLLMQGLGLTQLLHPQLQAWEHRVNTD